jgi:hypothetical protein
MASESMSHSNSMGCSKSENWGGGETIGISHTDTGDPPRSRSCWGCCCSRSIPINIPFGARMALNQIERILDKLERLSEEKKCG